MSSRSRRICYGEVLPFLLMIFLQCGQVGLSTLFKQASREGMNYMVFIFYSYTIAGLVLLPFYLIFERRKKLPQINKLIVGRFILLGFLGYVGQMLGFMGIDYSSPTMASSISNLTPAITFALALLLRMEKVNLGSLSSQAKILGTILSIAGALVVVLYEGPKVIRNYRTFGLSYHQTLSSEHSNWVIGGLLLISGYLLLSIVYIIQTQAVQDFPTLLLVSVYNLCVAVFTAPVTLFAVSHISAWTFSYRMMLITILYNGLFGNPFVSVLLAWGLHVKGPVYVALFTSFSIVIAAVMGVIFLWDSLFLGTVVGAAIMSLGFYLCIWGKAKEERMEEEEFSFDHGSGQRAPLL